MDDKCCTNDTDDTDDDESTCRMSSIKLVIKCDNDRKLYAW